MLNKIKWLKKLIKFKPPAYVKICISWSFQYKTLYSRDLTQQLSTVSIYAFCFSRVRDVNINLPIKMRLSHEFWQINPRILGAWFNEMRNPFRFVFILLSFRSNLLTFFRANKPRKAMEDESLGQKQAMRRPWR